MVDNIREILEELGYKVKEYPKEFRMIPLYRESKNETVLSVYKDSGRWVDYSLGKTGDIVDLVQITLQLKDIDEAEKWLTNKQVNVSLFRYEPKQEITTPRIFDKESLLRLTNDYSYWEKRGVEEKILRRFGGGIAHKGKMAGRYVFPIYNSQNKIVGFAGRDIFNNNSNVSKWKLLGTKDKWIYPAFLNVDLLRRKRKVILVESIGDILSLFSAGIENSLVTFGIKLTSGLLNFLIRTDFQEILISFNNDEVLDKKAGNEAANEVRQKLLHYFDPHQIRIALPFKKDFGEMTKEEILLWKKELYQQVA